MNPKQNIAIIGAGPAGLAMARALKHEKIPFVIYEKHSGVGGIWDIDNPGTPMYESAHFISSKTLSGFPDFPMPDHFPDYPKRQQILEYLKSFADHYALSQHIRFDQTIKNIEKQADNTWLLTTQNGEKAQYDFIICASGPLWHPNTPTYRGNFEGEVRHANTYKKAEELINKRVLVVGGGNSAVDIATEAATYAAEAHLSMRRGYYFIPKHIFGQPTDVFAHAGPKLPTKLNQWVLKKLLRMVVGDQTKFGLPKPDHELMESHPILNSQIMHHTSHGNLKVKPDVDYFEGKTVFFKDNTSIEVDLILYATGYNQQIPYMSNYFDWQDERPQLFLNIFNRKYDNLFVLGFMETNSAAYELFTEQDKLLVNYIKAKITSNESAKSFREKVITEFPDMTGGIKFLKTARNTGYVDSDTYRAYLLKIQKQLGWTPYKKGFYS